jgi:hypothetical protein
LTPPRQGIREDNQHNQELTPNVGKRSAFMGNEIAFHVQILLASLHHMESQNTENQIATKARAWFPG